jgi:hypothetical protein
MRRRLLYPVGRDLLLGCVATFLFIVFADGFLLQEGQRVNDGLRSVGEVAACGIFVGIGMMAISSAQGHLPGRCPPPKLMTEQKRLD